MNGGGRRPRRGGFKLRECLFLDGNDGDRVARAPRGVEHQEGKSSVAGDET